MDKDTVASSEGLNRDQMRKLLSNAINMNIKRKEKEKAVEQARLLQQQMDLKDIQFNSLSEELEA